MKKYSILLFFATISILGTAMTSFSLGLWILNSSQTTFVYALISFLTVLPPILLGPFIGGFIDRFDKRKIIIYGQLLAGFFSIVLMTLYHLDFIKVWHVLLITFLNSIVNGFIGKAFYVSTVVLVPKEKISKAKGLEETSIALTTILVPIIVPLIYNLIGLEAVFVIDILTFSVSIIGFLTIKYGLDTATKKKFTVRNDFKEVKDFFTSKKGMVEILVFYSVISFFLGGLGILITPMVLGFSDEIGLSITMILAGIGSFLGGGLMSFFKGFMYPMKSILNLLMIVSFILVLFLFIPISITSVSILCCLFMFFSSIMMICDHTFWQNTVPYDLQGRVSGYKGLIIGIWVPVSFLITSVLIDYVLIPVADQIPLNRNYYPGTDRTYVILILFSLIGGLVFVFTGFIKRKKIFKQIDLLYIKKLKHPADS
ncbi:MFS transporter [Aquimarina sp. 433]